MLFVDALVARRIGASYLTTARGELVLVALISIGCWWLFEWYDAPQFWRGGAHRTGLWWQYHGVEPDAWLRRVGYDWSFATIFPALFLTAALRRSVVFRRMPVRPRRPSPVLLKASIALGAVFVSVLLLEPLNYRRGRPSWLGALATGDASLLLALSPRVSRAASCGNSGSTGRRRNGRTRCHIPAG